MLNMYKTGKAKLMLQTKIKNVQIVTSSLLMPQCQLYLRNLKIKHIQEIKAVSKTTFLFNEKQKKEYKIFTYNKFQML